MSIIQFAVNLAEMEEFEPLPDGLYLGEVQECEVKFSEKMPQGYVYVQYHISPDQFPVDYDVANAPEGLTVVFARTSVPEASNRRSIAPFRAFLRAHKMPLNAAEFNSEEMIGKQTQLLLKRNEYQGALINNVEGVQAVPEV